MVTPRIENKKARLKAGFLFRELDFLNINVETSCNLSLASYPYKMRYIWILLIIFMTFSLLSCKSKKINGVPDDPYGVVEAENYGGISEKLLACSENIECPDYAQAMFWVAADILSGASSETININANDYGLTANMSADVISKKIENIVINIFASDVPSYDFKDPEYKRGVALLHKAHDAGSVYASNELGVLFMEQSELQNLKLAEKYFQTSSDLGDPHATYNLARISKEREPNNHVMILYYLKLASEIGDVEFQIMYQLGLEEYGTNNEKKKAKKYLNRWWHFSSMKHEIIRQRDTFKGHFLSDS